MINRKNNNNLEKDIKNIKTNEDYLNKTNQLPYNTIQNKNDFLKKTINNFHIPNDNYVGNFKKYEINMFFKAANAYEQISNENNKMNTPYKKLFCNFDRNNLNLNLKLFLKKVNK
jgi:hypothetical protein